MNTIKQKQKKNILLIFFKFRFHPPTNSNTPPLLYFKSAPQTRNKMKTVRGRWMYSCVSVFARSTQSSTSTHTNFFLSIFFFLLNLFISPFLYLLELFLNTRTLYEREKKYTYEHDSTTTSTTTITDWVPQNEIWNKIEQYKKKMPNSYTHFKQ